MLTYALDLRACPNTLAQTREERGAAAAGGGHDAVEREGLARRARIGAPRLPLLLACRQGSEEVLSLRAFTSTKKGQMLTHEDTSWRGCW